MRLYEVRIKDTSEVSSAGNEPAALEMKFNIHEQQFVIPENVSVSNSRAIVANLDLNVSYFVSGNEQRVELLGKDVEIYRTVLHSVRKH